MPHRVNRHLKKKNAVGIGIPDGWNNELLVCYSGYGLKSELLPGIGAGIFSSCSRLFWIFTKIEF